MKKDDIRDDKGRFRAGAPGRPKGSTNKRKGYSPAELKAHIDAGVDERLKGLLRQAVDVIERRLGNDDLKAALWLLDSGRGRRTQRLSAILAGQDLSSVEGVVGAAQRLSDMMLRGELGVGEASEALANLWRYAQMRGYLQLDDIREMLEEIEARETRRPDNAYLPTWGRLREAMAQQAGGDATPV